MESYLDKIGNWAIIIDTWHRHHRSLVTSICFGCSQHERSSSIQR